MENCLGGSYRVGSCPNGELSSGEVSWWGVALVGNRPSGELSFILFYHCWSNCFISIFCVCCSLLKPMDSFGTWVRKVLIS